MPVDIFPYIDIPVVSIVWHYPGLAPEEMEKRMVTIFERAMTTTVNDIEHIESQSYTGVSVIRVFFQPNAKIDMALAQVTAISQTILRVVAAGHLPAEHPQVRRLQRADPPARALERDARRAAALRSGQNFIRTQLATDAGRVDSAALMAENPVRSWSTSIRSALRQATFADRRLEAQ